ncbi:MAG TPA: SgcJ/EcaC family oxidoreductase [Saprospiraceae bacterium]|nr:SgcJ/EcaC family oxidoreductase [Saprospiraceae bacterium]
MKSRSLSFIGFCLFSASTQLSANPVNPENQTNMQIEEIVHSIIATLESGWNTGNGAEFARPFADISQFTDIRGTFHQNASPKALGEAHQGLFMSIYKGSKVTYQLVQASQIDDNTILANVSAALDAPSGPLAGKNSSAITMVITKTGEEWKIKAFHNTLVINR